jgi:Icc-related predicted phosphoesterase
MLLTIISDTHGKHKAINKLPPADVIIHCGDFTTVGKEHEVRNFMKWFSKLEQYKYKIIIAGNHDKLFEHSGHWARQLIPKNVIYLEDSGVDIEGIKFYGTPYQLPFMNWAFQKPEERISIHWEAIPDDTDVLITHSPPYMVMDWGIWSEHHTGSPSLYKEIIERIKPNINCFGHIHNSHGIKVIDNTTFINASILDDDYLPAFKPVLVEFVDGVVNIR